MTPTSVQQAATKTIVSVGAAGMFIGSMLAAYEFEWFDLRPANREE